MYNFDFSYNEYQMFLERCPFSEEEIEIINMRRKGKSNTSICYALSISETTLSRRINKIYNKIMKEI